MSELVVSRSVKFILEEIVMSNDDKSHLNPPSGMEKMKKEKVGKKQRGVLEDILFDKMTQVKFNLPGDFGQAGGAEKHVLQFRLSPADIEYIEVSTKKTGKYKSGMLVEARIDNIEFSKVRLIPN